MKPLKRFGIELGKEDYQEAAVYGLACVYLRIEKEISDYLRPFNLTPAKFNAMLVIRHQGRDKGLSQVEIGKSLIVTASNITRLIDKLQKEGYIERFSRQGDRRINLIKISKNGINILDKVWPGYHRKILDIADCLDKDELKQISGLFLKWSDKISGKRC